jgi:hypothetical protein
MQSTIEEELYNRIQPYVCDKNGNRSLLKKDMCFFSENNTINMLNIRSFLQMPRIPASSEQDFKFVDGQDDDKFVRYKFEYGFKIQDNFTDCISFQPTLYAMMQIISFRLPRDMWMSSSKIYVRAEYTRAEELRHCAQIHLFLQ